MRQPLITEAVLERSLSSERVYARPFPGVSLTPGVKARLDRPSQCELAGVPGESVISYLDVFTPGLPFLTKSEQAF